MVYDTNGTRCGSSPNDLIVAGWYESGSPCDGIPDTQWQGGNIDPTNAYSGCVSTIPPDVALETCASEGSTCLLASNESSLCVGDRYYEKSINIDGKSLFQQNGACDPSNPAFTGDPLTYDDFTGLEATVLESSSTCITDQTGGQVCVASDSSLTYEGDDLNFQVSENNICALENGVYNCVQYDVSNPGCGYFNGEVVCYDTSGTQIEDTDPDSPLNGGNRDGNSTNDAISTGGAAIAETPTERATRSRDDKALAGEIATALKDAGIGSGGGAGEGEEPTGAGDCDPTASNYLECLNNDKSNVDMADVGEGSNFDNDVKGLGTTFLDDVNNSQTVQAFDNLKNIIPSTGGTCPAIDIDLSDSILGMNVHEDTHCTMVETIRPTLSTIMLIVYTLLGARTFMEA